MWRAASTIPRTDRKPFIKLHMEHAVERLAMSYGPIKPPLLGRRSSGGQMRSLVSPLPSAGAGSPQTTHGARMSSHAACSEMLNGTFCSEAIRLYDRILTM